MIKYTCWKAEPTKDGRFMMVDEHLKIVEKYKASVRHAQKGLMRIKNKYEKGNIK